MKLATAAQMRELDRAAIQDRGVPSLELMERAARAVARTALELAERVSGGEAEGHRRAAVFCGVGNNGGDGLAAARLLREAGMEVRAFLVGDRARMTPDCREMVRRLAEAGDPPEDFVPGDTAQEDWAAGCSVAVDALFGIGLSRPAEGDHAAAITLLNAAGVPVAAVDIPSGVETDSGRILGTAVQAAATVTFTLGKPGLFVGKGAICAGEVTVADIGIPQDLIDGLTCPVRTVERGDISLPRRARDAHKGNFGRAYILAGSVGYTGAPVLAARGAVRTGAGLVFLGTPAPAWPVVAGKLDIAMPHPLSAGKEGMLSVEAVEQVLERLKDCGVCLIGPGLGRSSGVAAVIRHILAETHLPVVLDADGINALEGHIDILDSRKGLVTVLTPHDGEFARLGGDLSGGDRLRAAGAFAVEHGCCLVLKGHRTITAFPDGTAYVNTTGNPGMAKGGSGDVLAGMILSLLGQGLPPRQAVPAAVWLHGAAGDLAAAELGEYAMTAGDLAEHLPEVLKSVSN